MDRGAPAGEGLTPAASEEPPQAATAPSPTWRPIEALFVALVGFGLGSVVSAAIAAFVADPGLRRVLVVASFGPSLGLATLLWVRILHRGALRSLGLSSRRPFRDLVVGLGGGLLLYLVTVRLVAPLVFTLVSLVTGGDVTPPRQDILPQDPSGLVVGMAGAYAILGAPLGEELFFRGFLFGALRRRFRFAGAASISALFFGLVHVLPLLMPLMFVVGLGLAYLYERRGSLLAPIAAHAAFNVVGFTLIALSA